MVKTDIEFDISTLLQVRKSRDEPAKNARLLRCHQLRASAGLAAAGGADSGAAAAVAAICRKASVVLQGADLWLS